MKQIKKKPNQPNRIYPRPKRPENICDIRVLIGRVKSNFARFKLGLRSAHLISDSSRVKNIRVE